jgi:hypothetical protein
LVHKSITQSIGEWLSEFAGGCWHLKVGGLLRGLRAVTECSDKGTYVDRTGRRRGVTEYLVPPAERA